MLHIFIDAQNMSQNFERRLWDLAKSLVSSFSISNNVEEAEAEFRNHKSIRSHLLNRLNCRLEHSDWTIFRTDSRQIELGR